MVIKHANINTSEATEKRRERVEREREREIQDVMTIKEEEVANIIITRL
jgi:hypothetical protein